MFSGIICFGYGIASLFVSPLQTLYVNPNNLRPERVSGYDNVRIFTQSEVLDKVPKLYIIYGIISAVLQIPLSFLIKQDKSDTVSNGSLSTFFTRLKFVTSKAEFWIIFIIFALNKIPLAYTATFSKMYGELFIVSDIFLSTVIGMAGLFNALGRLFWGYVKDRVNTRYIIVIMSLTISLSILTWFLCRYIPVIFISDIMFTIGVWASFFTCCGNYAVFPAIAARFFGDENFGVAYGVLYLSQGIGSFASAGVTEYVPIWIPLALTVVIVCVISAIFAFALPKETVDNSNGESVGLIKMNESSNESLEQ